MTEISTYKTDKSSAVNKKSIYEFIIIIFLLLQPIIDLITSLMIQMGLEGVSFGIIFRAGFMIYLAMFVLLHRGGGTKKALSVIYLIAVAVFSLGVLAINIKIKGTAVAFTEFKGLVKAMYFPVVCLSLVYLCHEKKLHFSHKLMAVVLTIYTATIFFATVTDTYFYSYVYERIGSKGWFYAGNEIGTIIAILSPYVFLNLVSNENGKKNIAFKIVTIASLIFSILFIGTKVPVGGILLYCGLFFVVYFLYSRGKGNKKDFRKSLMILGVVLVSAAVSFNTPTYKNFEALALKIINVINPTEKDPTIDDEEREDVNSQLSSIILSNRDGFVDKRSQLYSDSSVLYKLIGTGVTLKDSEGNWSEHTVEQDLNDLKFHYGYAGLALCLAPITAFGLIFIIGFIKKFKLAIRCDKILTSCFSIALGCGIGVFAGHTLISPGVCIFICMGVVYSLQELRELKDVPKQIVETTPEQEPEPAAATAASPSPLAQ